MAQHRPHHLRLHLLLTALTVCLSTAVARAQPVHLQRWNSSFDLTSQIYKYTPVQLTDITTSSDSCVAALAGRADLTPRTIRYTLVDPTAASESQAGTTLAGVRTALGLTDAAAAAAAAAPVVVISSGRSQFLAQILSNALPDYGGRPPLNDVANWNILEYSSNRLQIAWFDDRRTQRPLYLVVDRYDLPAYAQLLRRVLVDGARNVKLFACAAAPALPTGTSAHPEAPTPTTGSGAPGGPLPPADLAVGFGTQRLCALKLMKEIGYRRAWLVDDNVGSIAGVQTLASIEALMTNPGTPAGNRAVLALGMTADVARDVEDRYLTVDAMSRKLNNQRPDGVAGAPPVPALRAFSDLRPGDRILQQAVLWNIELLGASNFAAAFVEGGEDVSMTDYLQRVSTDYFGVVANAVVVKANAGVNADARVPLDLDDDSEARKAAKRQWNQNLAWGHWQRERRKAEIWARDGRLRFRFGDTAVERDLSAFLEAVPGDETKVLGQVTLRGDGTQREAPWRTASKIVQTILQRCVRDGLPPDGRTNERERAAIRSSFTDSDIMVDYDRMNY